MEDSTDESATRDRAQSLRQLGFEEGARVLGRDMDLDIRERAKTSIDQFAKLLGGNEQRGYGSPAPNFGGMPGVGGLGGRLGGLHESWRHDRN